MSLCTVCGRPLCLHTSQTLDELRRLLNQEELRTLVTEPNNSGKLIELAKKNAHWGN